MNETRDKWKLKRKCGRLRGGRNSNEEGNEKNGGKNEREWGKGEKLKKVRLREKMRENMGYCRENRN